VIKTKTLFIQRAFSGVLEGVTSKMFLGASPRPIFLLNAHGKKKNTFKPFEQMNNLESFQLFVRIL